MKQANTLFLVIILACGILSLGGMPQQAQAQGSNPRLHLTLDKPVYYEKGETIEIRAFSDQAIPITLSVYWNWRTLEDQDLIYQNTRNANATWNLPTSGQRVGFYEFKINHSDAEVRTWRTLISFTDWNLETLPFSHTWLDLNYTLEGRSFKAERWGPQLQNNSGIETVEQIVKDRLQITYPKIPFEHTTNFFRNNMSFLVRLQGATWQVDLCYLTVHGGLKWIINGTLNNPQTFEFECNAFNPREWVKNFDTFRSESNLVFDWGDLRKAGEAFTWNATSKILSVEIHETFSLDPYVFEDGFEGSYPAPWDENGQAGCTKNYTTHESHHGDQAFGVYDLSTGDYGYMREIVGDGDYYVRSYVKFSADNFGSGSLTYFGPQIANPSGTTQAGVILHESGGDLYWGVTNREADYTHHINQESTASNPVANTWYCVEMFVEPSESDAGNVSLWVDGISRLTATGLDFHDDNIYYTETAFWSVNGSLTAIDVYADCFVTDTSYIGPESVGAQNVSFSPSAILGLLASLELQRESLHDASTILGLFGSATYAQEYPFSFSEILGLIDAEPTHTQEAYWNPSGILALLGSEEHTLEEIYHLSGILKILSSHTRTTETAFQFSESVSGTVGLLDSWAWGASEIYITPSGRITLISVMTKSGFPVPEDVPLSTGEGGTTTLGATFLVMDLLTGERIAQCKIVIYTLPYNEHYGTYFTDDNGFLDLALEAGEYKAEVIHDGEVIDEITFMHVDYTSITFEIKPRVYSPIRPLIGTIIVVGVILGFAMAMSRAKKQREAQ